MRKRLLLSLVILIIVIPVVLTGCEEFMLTINQEGDGEVIPEPGEYEYGEDTVVDLEATPAPGWRFNGWEGKVAEENERETSILMDEKQEVTAKFEEIEDPEEYTLTIKKEGTGAVDPAVGEHIFIENESVTLEATQEEGWIFSGWKGDIEEEEASISVLMDGDKTIEAVFEEVAVDPDAQVHWLFDNDEYPENTEPHGNFEFIEGKIGSAIKFDGETTYLEVDENVDVHNNPMTISFWMKFNEPIDREGEQVLYWAKPDGGWDQPEGWYINSWDSFMALGFIAGDAGIDIDQERAETFNEDEWFHVAIIYEDQTTTMLIDGEIIREEETGELPEEHEGPTWMGFNSPALGGGFFNGAIDDFRIYDYALSEEEINQIVN